MLWGKSLNLGGLKAMSDWELVKKFKLIFARKGQVNEN